MKKKLLSIVVLATICSGMAFGQVTMGSNEVPVKGALLDLKDGTATGNATATKGLLLPRVKLSDKNNLYPMFEADGANYKIGTKTYTKADEDAKHLGLMVYHIDKCTLEGTGLYVWNANGWKRLQANGHRGGINFNNDYFDLPSGHDARPLTAQNLTIGWTMPGSLTYTKRNKFGGGVPFAAANALPGSPLTVNPTSVDLLPTEMTISNPLQPWQSKETQFSFTDTECGNTTRTITLNQTHYALSVDGKFVYSQFVFDTPKTGTFDVEGNVSYKVTVKDKYNVLKSITPTTEGVHGGTIKDYPFVTTSLNKTTFNFETNAANTHEICEMLFSDTEIPKRFKDITLSIVNCDLNSDDGSIEDWVKQAGFTDADIAATPIGGTFKAGGQAVTKPNGIQLHRDQDGNLFLSGNFGYEDAAQTKERRWMLNNLSAKNYAKAHNENKTPIHKSDPDQNTPEPCWMYLEVPKTTVLNPSTHYDANPREGLLYTFDCATGGKSVLGVDDHDTGTSPQTTNVQGICPNGWHLPSDREWTELEYEYDANLIAYSSLNSGGGFTGRDEEHTLIILPYVTGMIDACALKGTNPVYRSRQGASNWVNDSDKKPGLNIIMIYGHAVNSSYNTILGLQGASWTSSAIAGIFGRNQPVIRHIGNRNMQPYEFTIDKTWEHYDTGFSSVRCKKTN